MSIKYCADCIYSNIEKYVSHPNYNGTMRCTNDKVNIDYTYALSSWSKQGKECSEERRKVGGWRLNKPACGIKGKLFKLKEI